MIDYCFIIPRTPVLYRTPLRDFLWKACLHSLQAQEGKNWIAVIIGPDEKLKHDQFVFFEQDLLPKQGKIQLALDWLGAQGNKPRFLVRLDDDDIVSCSSFQQHAAGEYDCITDRHHSFFEISSGKIAQQKRPWFPNTILHRYEHAITIVEAETYTGPLICHDHSAEWHRFYATKKVHYTKKNSPLYLRVLSPHSITSRASDAAQSGHQQYMNYLLQFGDWMTRPTEIEGFEKSVSFLVNGVSAAADFELPVLKWPVLKLWQNKWRSIKQEFVG